MRCVRGPQASTRERTPAGRPGGGEAVRVEKIMTEGRRTMVRRPPSGAEGDRVEEHHDGGAADDSPTSSERRRRRPRPGTSRLYSAWASTRAPLALDAAPGDRGRAGPWPRAYASKSCPQCVWRFQV